MFAQIFGVVVLVRASLLLLEAHPWSLGLCNILHLNFRVKAANVPQTQKRIAREKRNKFPKQNGGAHGH